MQTPFGNGESQTVEYKTTFDKAAIETLVAFANTQGGTVWVGVSDAGQPIGTTLGKETLNEWLVHIKAATSPAIIPELTVHTFNGKTLVAVQVAEFPVKPVSTKGRYYKRQANTNQTLSPSQIADLYLQSLQLSWDSYPAPHAGVAQLSADKIQRFISQVNAAGRFVLDPTQPNAALEKLSYISQGQPTWAAMLLFAQQPLRHHIHMGRFKNGHTIIDDRQFTDTLFEAVDQAMKFLVSHISVAFQFDGSIHRKERFAYPLPALREALLNAVVHRDYRDPSDIQVKIFDDRITLFSPGGFHGGLTVQDVQTDNYRSSLRNKLVAEGFYLTAAIEKYGSGFIRIRQALADYPEIRFSIEEMQGGVMTTFTLPTAPSDKSGEGVNVGVNEGVGEGVGEGVSNLLTLIATQPGLRTPALAQKLETSPKNVERWLRHLKTQGLVTFQGSPKTGGYHATPKNQAK